MRVLISDYESTIKDNVEATIQYLKEQRPDWEIRSYSYTGDTEELIEQLQWAEAVITAFLPLNREVLSMCGNLQCISVNATGYNTVDLDAARENKISVVALGEYCTDEVAEHTISLILALNRGLKQYSNRIDGKSTWDYVLSPAPRKLKNQKIGIFGYGRIGHGVAKRAKALGMEVYIYQSKTHQPSRQAQQYKDEVEVRYASKEEILDTCSIITNHMSQGKGNIAFFGEKEFQSMKRQPVFINTGRGQAVDEVALEHALDEGWLYGAGLDVLYKEAPDLQQCGLTRRDNVIITPHAAFYSESSMQTIIQVPCDNLIAWHQGEYEKITHWIE